jgi:hypothetical protein
MGSSYTEVEEQERTRIEKVLLFALVSFLLVGGFWSLGRIGEFFPVPILSSSQLQVNSSATTDVGIEEEVGVPAVRARVEKLQEIANNRQATLSRAQEAQHKAEKAYEFRREEYRTAMEAHRATGSQQSAFEASREALRTAAAATGPARREAETADAALKQGQRQLSAIEERASAILQARASERSLKVFAATFGFASGCLGLSWIAWQAGRRRRWRYQTILTALFTAAVLQLLFLLFRYCWELFLQDYATLGIAALGTIVCILALVGIKRWLFSPERLAEARLAKQACPSCSTPFSESQQYCWHCGHLLVEPCHNCGESRLRFAPHCGRCGEP